MKNLESFQLLILMSLLRKEKLRKQAVVKLNTNVNVMSSF